MDEILDSAEMAAWTAWKRACDVVMYAVGEEIGIATGMSGADFAVLTRVVELGDGSLRQQELASMLGWGRSRLSRQVSRMETRGLVLRTARGAARMITATDAGKNLVTAARPAHATAVRRVLFNLVPAGSAPQFWSIIHSIGSTPLNAANDVDQ